MEQLDFFSARDPELDTVATHLLALDLDGARWSHVVRQTYDMLYNGQETGRYRWDQLHKTEKTHFGTLFEINAQREFGFYDGSVLDFSISGIEVDAKWSQSDGGWMLPPESFGHIALVATGSDLKSQWSVGVVRVSETNRRSSVNRDAKTSLNTQGRRAIRWLWRDAKLIPNVLLQLPRPTVDKIFDSSSGQERVLRLLREAEGRIIHRSTIATVARQLDPMKRLRGNGGARTRLAADGFLVLSGEFHADLAREFGTPVPERGEIVAFRVVRTDGAGVMINGSGWKRWQPGDEAPHSAPLLPSRPAN